MCENPKTINYSAKDDKDLQIEISNGKPGEEGVNSLKGSGINFVPNDDGSEVNYIINGKGNPVSFVDGTFETINIEEITVSLVTVEGTEVTSEKV